MCGPGAVNGAMTSGSELRYADTQVKGTRSSSRSAGKSSTGKRMADMQTKEKKPKDATIASVSGYGSVPIVFAQHYSERNLR